jgi:hypothetical protein
MQGTRARASRPIAVDRDVAIAFDAARSIV